MGEEKVQGQTIGIMGANSGCGVTHLTLLLANYLAAIEWKKTAVLEWNTCHALKELIAVCTGRRSFSAPISILGVDYFPDGGPEELARCLQEGYECILMDFGCASEGRRAEFLQCDGKLFLASLNEWKMRNLLEQKDWMLKGKGNWKYLAAFGSDEARWEIKRRLGLPFMPVPYAPDVFSIERDMAIFLRTLWREKEWADKQE